MCGITGVIGEKSSKKTLDEMLLAQHHRGPDNRSSFIEKNISLGHNRLSIIDLSSDANQPFYDETQRYVLVFNGEIYNYLELRKELDYEFKTESDTEVLLAAYIKWGKDCLHKLNGMFAFAIWDRESKKFFAARDRFGVKPFYYHLSAEGDFYFASEIKSIHKAGIKKLPNKKVWASYFVYGSYGMPNETFWESIYQLPGGSILSFSEKNVEICKWYVFEEEIKKHKKLRAYEDIMSEYTSLLKDSIKLRFRSDVPVGFNVSGGLDSSALLAFVNLEEGKDKINAYTFYTDDERYDELPWVKEMIALTNNPLQQVLFKAGDVEEFSKNISMHQDEPFGGIPTLAYAKIFQESRKKGTIVLLDGQGMDEQWAGYDYYLKNTNSTIQGVNSSPFRSNVLSEEIKSFAEKPIYPKPFDDDLLNLQYRDLFYTKIPRALRFNDRISMAFSTELREPFLDYRLVELAFSQPKEYKIKGNVQKKMLRDIVSEYLSDSISYAPKRPLQTPQREWLGEDLKSFVSSEINAIEDSEFSEWFVVDELKKEYQNYLNGDNDSSFHIWQWMNYNMLMS
jgi:asparagine synthase (glutamine-hydrolysing)